MLELIAQRLGFGLQAGVVGQQFVGVVADLFAHMGVFLVQVPVGGAQGVQADFPRLLVFEVAPRNGSS